MILVFVAVFFLLPLVAVASMARGRTFARALGNSRGGFGRGRNLPQGSGRRISARQHVSSPVVASKTKNTTRRDDASDAGSDVGNNARDNLAKNSAKVNSIPEVALVTDEDILSYGLLLVGFDKSRQKVTIELNLERFKAHFGVGHSTVRGLFQDLKEANPTVDNKVFNYAHAFMTLNWMKLYDTEHVLAGRWGLHEETIRNKVKAYTKSIQDLKGRKIKFCAWKEGEVFILSVDGVHFQIYEVRTDPGSKWFDPKSQSAGLAYEIALAIRENQIAWINGPFPASTHDITMFRGGKEGNKDGWDQNSLYFQIPKGKRCVGDSGYSGEPEKISVTRDDHPAELKKFFARVKSRQETVNSRLKSFGILGQRFRHGMKNHKMCLEASCVIIQYDMENGHPLFEV